MKVLVFRIGSLGDTLVSLPALWRLRQEFAGAEFTLLCDQQQGKPYVLASDLLTGSGIFDRYLVYPVHSGASRIQRACAMLGLALRLRQQAYDVLAYLAPSRRHLRQVRRDRLFFKLGGMTRMIGIDGPFYDLDAPRERPMPVLPNESELIMRRLEKSGLMIGDKSTWRFDLNLVQADERELENWVNESGVPVGSPWVGVGPGSKMPAKVWPRERFAEVLKSLHARYGLLPVIFGGAEDVEAGKWIVGQVGHGAVAAGKLGLRTSAAALRRCKIYLGNDTGTMHLAASSGTPCVVVFSARDHPGLWYPNGGNHIVLRRQVACEGCGLLDCVAEQKRCMTMIGVDEVLAATSQILG